MPITPQGDRAIATIDVSALRTGDPGDAVAHAIDRACREHGFFAIVGHGIAPALADDLQRTARAFFALPDARKRELAMARAGRRWRGYFPLGGELTSGVPDAKAGLYFGSELPDDDPRVLAGVALHGANLWPADVPDLRPTVLAWIATAAEVAQLVMSAIARALGLAADYFARTCMQDPTLLFRIFHYPPTPSDAWGVGEHTDYGILTLLLQDDVGGLEVRSRGAWISVPPEPGALVCNIGDMLDRMTGGIYRSTPHRVRNASARDRYSFPLFFDPSWDARVVRVPGAPPPDDDAAARWDRASVHAFDGTWGEYLMAKVARVFPALTR
ncbi:MAG: 2-oxoglutarate and iron-dependent oxygenase domain-containing protein [Kofleriaceae bacterium]